MSAPTDTERPETYTVDGSAADETRYYGDLARLVAALGQASGTYSRELADYLATGRGTERDRPLYHAGVAKVIEGLADIDRSDERPF